MVILDEGDHDRQEDAAAVAGPCCKGASQGGDGSATTAGWARRPGGGLEVLGRPLPAAVHVIRRGQSLQQYRAGELKRPAEGRASTRCSTGSGAAVAGVSGSSKPSRTSRRSGGALDRGGRVGAGECGRRRWCRCFGGRPRNPSVASSSATPFAEAASKEAMCSPARKAATSLVHRFHRQLRSYSASQRELSVGPARASRARWQLCDVADAAGISPGRVG